MEEGQMSQILPALFLIIAFVVLGTLGRPYLARLDHELSQLLRESKRHLPVYSAETVRGKEAEFIRDSLPRRFPTALAVIALLLLGAAAWWLSR